MIWIFFFVPVPLYSFCQWVLFSFVVYYFFLFVPSYFVRKKKDLSINTYFYNWRMGEFQLLKLLWDVGWVVVFLNITTLEEVSSWRQYFYNNDLLNWEEHWLTYAVIFKPISISRILYVLLHCILLHYKQYLLCTAVFFKVIVKDL